MKKRQQKVSRVKHVGIVADAAALGVNRIHLYLVLTGARTSHSLLRRYNQLTRLRPSPARQEGTR